MNLFFVPMSRLPRLMAWVMAALVAALVIPATGTLYAQSAPKHLNPVIEKLAAGKPFVGVQTGDLSLENARALARANIDYVYLEMEHGPGREHSPGIDRRS